MRTLPYLTSKLTMQITRMMIKHFIQWFFLDYFECNKGLHSIQKLRKFSNDTTKQQSCWPQRKVLQTCTRIYLNDRTFTTHNIEKGFPTVGHGNCCAFHIVKDADTQLQATKNEVKKFVCCTICVASGKGKSLGHFRCSLNVQDEALFHWQARITKFCQQECCRRLQRDSSLCCHGHLPGWVDSFNLEDDSLTNMNYLWIKGRRGTKCIHKYTNSLDFRPGPIEPTTTALKRS